LPYDPDRVPSRRELAASVRSQGRLLFAVLVVLVLLVYLLYSKGVLSLKDLAFDG